MFILLMRCYIPHKNFYHSQYTVKTQRFFYCLIVHEIGNKGKQIYIEMPLPPKRGHTIDILSSVGCKRFLIIYC